MTDFLIPGEEAFDGFLEGVLSGDAELAVLFTAPAWCVPCRRFEPHWKKAHEQPVEGIVFATVDMGDSPEDTGQHWATARFGIRGVPQVKLFTAFGNIDIKSRAVVPLLKEITSHG